jgi:uncharacterized protein
MKYLLVLAVVMVAIHIWRKNRREALEEEARARDTAARPVPAPVAMVACRHCGTHLPRAEAVEGSLGLYCGAEHRQLNEPGAR